LKGSFLELGCVAFFVVASRQAEAVLGGKIEAQRDLIMARSYSFWITPPKVE
jgi:hypothetical protein